MTHSKSNYKTDTGDALRVLHHQPKDDNKERSFSTDIHNLISWNTNSKFYIWAIYLSFFFISFFIRIAGIGVSDKGSPIFDEKHYVPQAEQIKDLGIENNPAYGLVVHPFLGKKLISLGIDVFGYTPLGWRIASIIAGCIMIILLMISVRALTHSMTLAILSGILLNTEGVNFVMSRLGMLDIFIALFATMAMTFFACRVATGIPFHDKTMPVYKDPYIYGAGISIGLALSIKISGLYLSATTGVMMFIIGLYMVFSQKLTIMRFIQSMASAFVSIVIIPVVIASLFWIPWFKDYFSVYRNSSTIGNIEYRLPGFLDNIAPDPLRSFYNYQAGVMTFHTELTNSAGNIHPWESKPVDWILGKGSLLLFSDNNTQLWIASNRSIWIFTSMIFIISIIMFLVKKNMAWGIVCAGFIATYIPWLFVYDRQMYIFYIAPIAPFLITGICLLIKVLIDYGSDHQHILINKISMMAGTIILVIMVLTVMEFILASPYIFYGSRPENFIDSNTHFLKLPESFYIENGIHPHKK